jgi:tetratricopeptide (TPR) repeat protein
MDSSSGISGELGGAELARSSPRRGRSPMPLLAAAIGLALFASCAGGPKIPGGTQAPAKPPKGQELSPEQKRIQAVEAAATLLDKGDAQDAAKAADALASISASVPEDSNLKLAQAAALVSAGKLAEARSAIDAILATEPSNVPALSMGAELARFDGDDKARRSFLDRALAAAPGDPTVLASWGGYYLDVKAWTKAEDFYRRALAADAKSADAALGLGRTLYREAKYPEAEAQLTAAIALEPASPLAYSDRSRALYQQGKYKEAEADLDTAIAKAPDEAWLYLDRGRYRTNKDDLAGGESDFDRAIALDPGYFLSYAYRGGIREEKGEDELALADYRKVIELYPDYWYSFESAGAAAFRLGLWPEAAEDFKRAYSVAPDRYEYAIASAIALWRSGKPKEASAYAAKIAPGIDREKNGIYWSMLRLLQDQNDSSAELELKIQAEKKLDLKSAMLFYLSEYWICRGKTTLAEKYLDLGQGMKREDTLEYRLLLAERRRAVAGTNG